MESNDQAPALSANIRLGWKWLTVTSTLAYNNIETIKTVTVLFYQHNLYFFKIVFTINRKLVWSLIVGQNKLVCTQTVFFQFSLLFNRIRNTSPRPSLNNKPLFIPKIP